MSEMKTVALLLLASGMLFAHEGHSHAPAAAKKLASPIANTPEDLAAGKKLYEEKCAACHGADGRLAAGAKVKAADLSSHHAAMLTPGEIYWVTTHGIPASGMPPNAGLSVKQRWQVVGYTRGLAGK